MRYFSKWRAVAGVLLLAGVYVLGCSSAPAETEAAGEENGNGETGPVVSTSPDNDCEEIEQELQELKEKYGQLTADYSQLNTEYSELNTEYSELNAEYEHLEADCQNTDRAYDELSGEYTKLQADYTKVMQGGVVIEEADLENAIFDLVNEERVNAGVGEVERSDGMYFWAKEHADSMASAHKVELSDYSYWQAVARNAGHATAEQMAIATMKLWQEDTSYANNFLDEYAKYGCAAVARTGDVYYIVFFNHIQP